MKIACKIAGSTPLLCNRFTEQAAAKVSAGSSSSITVSAKGTPRDQAAPRVYTMPNGDPMIPGTNIYRAIIDAGAFHKAGRKQITTGRSSLVPAGIVLLEPECPLINPFTQEPAAWEVDSRSVVNPATGGRMMCHRPRFDAWELAFTLDVDLKMFDVSITRILVDDAGSKLGLGDFRPSRKGPFGRFLVTKWEIEQEIDVSATKKPKTKAA